MTLTHEERQRRAEDAKQLLENPLLSDAFVALETAYTDEWKKSNFSETDRRETAYFMLLSLQDLESALKAFVTDGEISKSRLKRS